MVDAREARSTSLTDEQYEELNAICNKIKEQAYKQNGVRFITVNGFSTVLIWDILSLDLKFFVKNLGQDSIQISW